MSASNAFETLLLQLIFENANAANVGDATGLRGSTTAGVFYVGLHTADPGEAGAQNTTEANYTGYARVSVARSTAGWTVTGNTVVNDAAVTFGACTAGSSTCTHFSLGTDVSGAGNLLMSGALTGSLAVTAGVTPSFAAGALTATFD
ncbi:MAG: phage tail fiber protein [Pseudoxanthomonas sp.]